MIADISPLESSAAAAAPQCIHSRIHPGLDSAYCPSCKRSFGPRSPEYKIALELPGLPESEKCSGGRIAAAQLVPIRTPEHFLRHTTASGWIERYLAKGRWEHHRYCWQEGRKGKPKRLHIPKDSGRLAAVKSAIALHRSPSEIEQLIKSWRQQPK